MFPTRLVSFVAALFITLSSTCTVQAQEGALTAPRNLIELTDRAEFIVHGLVTDVRSEAHPELKNLKTIVVTLRVKESLKGAAPPIYSFRQFIWDMRDRSNGAGYQPGQEVLLMMNKSSSLGLTSPVGLEQGRFRIVRDSAGRKIALNGHGNAGLFHGVAGQMQQRKVSLSTTGVRMVQQKLGGVPLEEFSVVIRQLVERKK